MIRQREREISFFSIACVRVISGEDNSDVDPSNSFLERYWSDIDRQGNFKEGEEKTVTSEENCVSLRLDKKLKVGPS